MRRKKRITVHVAKLGGACRAAMTGVGRFASERPDWTMRWVFGETQPLDEVWALQTDGLILLTEFDAPVADALASPIPTVTAGAANVAQTPHSVVLDMSKIGEVAAAHLMHIGPRRLACLAWDSDASRLQVEGFERYLSPHKLSSNRRLIARVQSSAAAHDREIVAWLKKLTHPAGVFVTCSRLAANLCEACHELGLTVPDDVAMIATGDDTKVAALSRPSLSVVDLPLEQVGYEAGQQLYRMLNGDAVQQVVLAPIQAVPAGSSDLWGVNDPQVRQVLEFIHANAHRPIGVRDVVKSVPVSRRTLEQKFRSIRKSTIMAEIRNAHLRLAMQQLVETNAPLSSISHACGLRDSAQLAVLMRRYTGLTPRQYRQKSQK